MPTILVIVGITGDLAKRKLLPALERLARQGKLPLQYKIVGITRQKNVSSHNGVEMFQMDLNEAAEFVRLKVFLDDIEKKWGSTAQKLFYLSVPPEIAKPIIGFLGEVGLAGEHTKLLLEKPSGSDRQSAEDLIVHTHKYFAEPRVYRIDHYLAKAMVQNIPVFRTGVPVFEKKWNAQHIERIEVVASEKIGIENRVVFYEQTGALRNLLQSHLLQVAMLSLMDLGENKLDVLKSLSASTATALRGQYESYKQEVGNPGSTTETFAAITLESSAPRWKGVPIVLATGKNLDKKATEVRVYFKNGQKLTLQLQLDGEVEVIEGYERVFLDAIAGEHSVFVPSEEVLECWRIVDPVEQLWKNGSEDLHIYKEGSSIESLLQR